MTAIASVAIVCLHCGNKEADAQTGRCLKCGKIAVSPSIADEFSHPVLGRNASAARHSPSANYRQRDSEPEPSNVRQIRPAEAPNSAPIAEPEPAPAPSNGPQIGQPDNEPPLAPEIDLRADEAPRPPFAFRLPDLPATTKWITDTRGLRDKLLAQAERAETQIAELRAEAEQHRLSADGFTRLLESIVVGDKPADGAIDSPQVPLPGTSTDPKPLGKWSKNADACIDCGRSDLPHCANGRCRSCDGRWRHARA